VDAQAPFDWQLPGGFPEPEVPADNQMSESKVELGRHLFYDTRLSGNETQSCASCHRPELAFAGDGARAIGSTGEVLPRGAMSLANVGYETALTWANPLLRELESQAQVPMFADRPVELGLSGMQNALLQRLRDQSRYRTLFAAAFPETGDAITLANVVRAIAAFERTLVSGDSPYDRDLLHAGRTNELSLSAKRGKDLFFSEELKCSHCHSGIAFTDSDFHNTGLYNLDGLGAYPRDNQGVFAVTGKPSDMGSFKTATLRNIAITAPYMHDGSIPTLADVVEHYAAGGRTLASGPNAGVGSANPLKSDLLQGFQISAQQKADLVTFLQNLTDGGFLDDSRFSDPW
jgi:cytochrome c peroxidase